MSALVDYKVTQIATAATSHPGIMPTHASGDLLVVAQLMDGNQTISTPSGWTSQGNAGITQVSFRVFTKVAASSSETFTGGTSASAAGVLIIAAVRGVDGTTPVHVTATRSVDDSSSPFAGVAATTSAADILMLSFIAVDGKTAIIHLDTDFTLLASGYAGSAVTGGMSTKWKASSGSVSAAAWYGEGNANTLAFTIGIKGDGTRKNIHQQADVTLGSMVDLCINYGTNNNPSLVNMPASLTLSTIGSKTLARIAPSNQTAAGLTPIWNSAKLSIGTTASTDLEGIQADFSVARDYTNRLLIGRYKFEEGALNYLGLPLVGDAAGAGIQFTLRDGSAYSSWTIGAQGTRTTKPEGFNFFVVQPDQATDTRYASSGTVVNTAIDGYLMTGQGYYASLAWIYTGIVAVNKLAPCGGTSTNPLTFEDFIAWANLAVCNQIVAIQEGAAVTLLCGVQWGGTEPLYIDMSRKTLQFKRSADEVNYVDYHVDANRIAHEFKPGGYVNFASATFISDTSQLFAFDSAFDSTDGTFVGANVIGFDVQLPTGFVLDPMNWISCPNFEQNGSTIPAGTTVTDTTIISDNPGLITGTPFSSSGGTGHGVEITTAGTYDWVANPDSGYGADASDDAFFYNNSGGAVVINLGPGDAVPTYKNGVGASTTINTYVQALTIEASEASALVQIYANSTSQTLIASGTGSASYQFVSAGTVYYEVKLAGFILVRSSATLADTTLTVTLAVDEAYNASHGLVYGTDISYNSGAGRLTINANQDGNDVYSCLVDAFIAESGLRNRHFFPRMNGPQAVTFTNGVEMVDSTSEGRFKRCGLRYENSFGDETAAFGSFELLGEAPTGGTAEYQQTAGSGTTDAMNSGLLLQLIQIRGDSTHGNFTKDTHLVTKYQTDGFREVRIDWLDLYNVAQLEGLHYVAASSAVAVSAPTGGSGATITLTDYGASPATYFGKDFSFKIVSDASGEDILSEYLYQLSGDGTYQGKDKFNWPSGAILEAGTKYETARSVIEGSAGAALKGLVVLLSDGSTAHPDFLRFQADDGTYYTPPVVSSINVSGMPTAGANIRLQIANMTGYAASARANSTAYAAGDKVIRATGLGTENTAGLYFVATVAGTSGGSAPTWNTTVGGTTTDGGVTWKTCAVLFYDDDPGASSYTGTYVDGEEFSEGDTYMVTFAEMNGSTSFKTYQTAGLVSSTGFSVSVAEQVDLVYATNAIDGSTQDGIFSPNFADDYIVLDSNTNFTAVGAYAYYCYTLTTSAGMWEFWGGVTALDVANYRINADVLDLYFDETAGFVRQTDSARIFRSDGVRPALDPTTGGAGVEVNWQLPVYGYDAGGGGFTSGDRADLLAVKSKTTNLPASPAATGDIPSATANANAVLAATLEGSESVAESLRLMRASAAGKLRRPTADTVTLYGADGTTERIAASVNSDGERLAVVTDGS